MPTRWRLSAGQRIGALLREALELDGVQQVESACDVAFCKFRAARRATPAHSRAGQQVLHHGQAFDQIVFPEHHADPAPRAPQRAAGQLLEILSAGKQDLARGRSDQPVHAADQRALAVLMMMVV